jgi:hypothetical protein
MSGMRNLLTASRMFTALARTDAGARSDAAELSIDPGGPNPCDGPSPGLAGRGEPFDGP